jgi:hypothetical protein
LALPVSAQREDTLAKGDFATWMIRHIDTRTWTGDRPNGGCSSSHRATSYKIMV